MSDEQVHGRWDKDQQRYEDGEESHPCVHAPDGPDWAGLRELYPAEPDHTTVMETCRDCRDALPYGSKLPRADFILWGKFFPPKAFGPKCTMHARKWFPIERVDQYAVYDLRSVEALLAERDTLRTENERLRAHIDAPWRGDDQ